jgi:chemotaxis protein MotB
MSHGGDDGNAERWLLTYADMITLLMAFFLMLYAMSIVNMDKFSQLALSVRSGFGGDVVDTTGGASLGVGGFSAAMPPDMPGNTFQLMSKIAGDVRESLPAGEPGEVQFLAEGDTVTIRLKADNVLFARGSADLTPHARGVLAAVARGIAPLPQDIRVEGHTCDLPVSSSQFPSNWELSAARATQVVLHFIRAQGIAPRRLGAIGYADTRPAYPNTNEANRARNRRIDIALIRSLSSAPPTPLDKLPRPPEVDIKPTPVSLSGADASHQPEGDHVQ